MVKPAKTSNEQARLNALYDYRILDSAPEQEFDDFTYLAALVCDVPTALITLVAEERQWFKSKIGIEACETSRDVSFCGHALHRSELLIIPDARIDERFHDNPLVTGEPHIRFYAGAPLRTTEGFNLGTLCVIDYKARTLSEDQKRALTVLARKVVAQMDLRRSLLGLEKRNSELTHTRDEALREAQLKSEFLANMSHEIRTPMNAVIGMSNILLDTSLKPEQKGFAETIRNSAESLLGLLNDILDFSKIEAGKMTLEQLQFDPREVIEGTLEMFSEKACLKKVELVSQIDPPVPGRVITDPGRLRQVLTNLIGNALKFTEKGSVRLVVKAEGAINGKTRLRFEVEDTGIGISIENQARLFNSFTQAEEGTARKFGGTGLGLAISKRIVELMGGEIGLRSRPEAGSTFWFTLPCEVVTASSPYKLSLTNTDIILASPSEMLMDSLERILSWWGGAVRKSVASTDALRITRELPSGRGKIIFVDRLLSVDPGFWGELAKIEAAVFLLSPLTERSKPEDLERLKIKACLLKPVKESALSEALKSFAADPVAARKTVALPASAGPIQGIQKYRVLLAEDNAINQKVGTILLHKLGCHPEIAGTGLEAFQLHARNPYDLIFMDCQMPEMDGYEATRKIREWEKTHSGKKTKIVALTASALAKDREDCFASGMDDFMTKPVRVGDFAKMLDGFQSSTNCSETA